MGFSGTDLFATDGIYYSCYDWSIEGGTDSGYSGDDALWCDYYRLAVLYDGASVGIYEAYVDFYDWYDFEGTNYI